MMRKVFVLAALTVAALFCASGAYADTGIAASAAMAAGPFAVTAAGVIVPHAARFVRELAAPAILRRAYTRDGFATYDQKTIDSTGAFLVGELERLDKTLHDPLVSYTWSRDIQLREDVTIGDEVSSFTNSSFSAAGGIQPNGKAWIGKDVNTISSISLDIGKTAQPLYLWGMEVQWTLPELVSAQQVGRPIDVTKYDAMQLKWNMDVDEQVYIGDTTLGAAGLLNSAAVVNVSNVPNGASASPLWTTKTPDEILKDVNDLLTSVWAAAGWAVIPSELRLSPTQYGYLVSQKVSGNADKSILRFLQENNLAAQNGQKLNIQPLKWLIGRGAGGTDRMFAYTNEKNRVRYPLVPLQRTPLEYRSLYQITTYYGRLGSVEWVYPETAGARDGI